MHATVGFFVVGGAVGVALGDVVGDRVGGAGVGNSDVGLLVMTMGLPVGSRVG